MKSLLFCIILGCTLTSCSSKDEIFEKDSKIVDFSQMQPSTGAYITSQEHLKIQDGSIPSEIRK